MKIADCVTIYTQSPEFERRASAYLESVARLRRIETVKALENALDRQSEVVLIFDLQSEGSLDLLPRFKEEWPETVLIAVGEPRSDPARVAAAAGALSIEDIDRGKNLQYAVHNAVALLKLKQENRFLRNENARFAHMASAGPEKQKKTAIAARKIFSRPFREFNSLNALLDRIVEELAETTHVSRAGIFIADPATGIYRFRAGIHCLEETREMFYPSDSPFARWLRQHNHMVASQTLEHIGNHEEKAMLLHTLKDLGSEAIIPLHAHDRMLGWVFIGPHSTGMPFELQELEEFGTIAGQICTTLENATLYEELGLQKTLAETLLDAIPSGIIAVEADGSIRWINRSARKILGLGEDCAAGQPAEKAGARVADVLRRALEQEEVLKAEEWVCPATQKRISMESRCLVGPEGCLGALAIIRDATEYFILEEKEDEVERASFWAKLASAISHEIHNPLVTIKTFAQLMPERYSDPEFRNEFSVQMLKEVDHLGRIVSQINQFAHPPQLLFRPLDIRKTMQTAVEQAAAKYPRVLVKARMDKQQMPEIKGDENVLVECFSHLIQNAIEARSRSREVEIKIEMESKRDEDNNELVEIAIRDDGKGIDPEKVQNVYSPFCTTKARGMGLGLPVARRILADHKGSMRIESGEKGTTVMVVLPVDAGTTSAVSLQDAVFSEE